MKINFSFGKSFAFKDLECGDVFMDDGKVFMKIEPFDIYNDDGIQVEVNAIALENGGNTSISKNHYIRRLNARLVIEVEPIN